MNLKMTKNCKYDITLFLVSTRRIKEYIYKRYITKPAEAEPEVQREFGLIFFK